MRVFKTKWFNKWASKENLSDEVLILAIKEMEKGLIDADLGGNVYKKRIRKPGQGKSGSTRTIIAFRIGEKAFFTFGFAKNDKDNINDKELEALKIVASELLGYSLIELEKAIKNGKIMEVLYE